MTPFEKVLFTNQLVILKALLNSLNAEINYELYKQIKEQIMMTEVLIQAGS